MLCWIQPYNNVNQPQVYTHPLHPEPLSLYPLSHSLRSSQSKVELPLLYSNFPLAISFTHGNIYSSVLCSQFLPPSSFPTVSTSPCSTSVSLFLPCKYFHQHHFSRFDIVVVQSLSCVRLFATLWTAALKASCSSPSPRVCSNSCP